MVTRDALIIITLHDNFFIIKIKFQKIYLVNYRDLFINRDNNLRIWHFYRSLISLIGAF